MRSGVPHFQAAGLSALSYRSVVDPSLCDPQQFAQIVAQMRPSNVDRAVTGAISCDHGQVAQWIEGPEAAVAELWDRIRLDPRHRLQWASAPTVVTARHFPGSPMKLAMTTADLARLGPWLIEDVVTLPDASHPAPDGSGQTFQWLQARAAALASVLTGPDPQVARRRLDAMLHDTGLAESAALVQAVLQDLDASWLAGATSDLQRHLALTQLQSALRLWLDVQEQPRTIGCALVSALPGTPDLCGVMLKVALLRRAGWSVRLLLPPDAERIRETVQDLQPDLIVLSGSQMSVRPAEMALLAGLLPGLAADCPAPVILGGKLAEIDPQPLLRMGAHAVCSAMAWIAIIAATVTPLRPVDPPATDDARREAALLAASRNRRN